MRAAPLFLSGSLFLASLIPGPASAEWPPFGRAICTAPNNQEHPEGRHRWLGRSDRRLAGLPQHQGQRLRPSRVCLGRAGSRVADQWPCAADRFGTL